MREACAAVGPCLQLAGAATALVRRLQRLFFLNEAHSLSNFLAADLGVARYPAFTITRTRSVFGSRADLEAYEAALQQAAELDDCLEVGLGCALNGGCSDLAAVLAVLQQSAELDDCREVGPGQTAVLKAA